jgi:hypothetical protein
MPTHFLIIKIALDPQVLIKYDFGEIEKEKVKSPNLFTVETANQIDRIRVSPPSISGLRRAMRENQP